jgi:serine/threonine protein kinase
LKRFAREFRAISCLQHPHIVQSLAFGQHGPVPYLIMEYVDGQSVGERIEREGRLPEAEAVRIVTQVAAALSYAHRHNVIHRDVKPDNILLTADGQAKLTDFGLAKHVSDEFENLTRTGRGLGTPNFVAPEQFDNARNVDLRCDIYALGATLYMMVTGEWPFAGANLLHMLKKKANNEITPARQLVPGLSEQTDRAIRWAMCVNPGERPTSCAEFLKALRGQPTPSSFLTELAPAPAAFNSHAGDPAPPANVEPGTGAPTCIARAEPDPANQITRQPADAIRWWHWLVAMAVAAATAWAGLMLINR